VNIYNFVPHIAVAQTQLSGSYDGPTFC